MDNQIAMLWMRGHLSFVEQLCVQSFVDAGHHVALYSYDEIGGVPDGVEARDARDILPEEGFLVHERTGSPALHSDVFRYKLLAGHDRTIWADTDAYCLRRFRTFEGHLHGWESAWDINGGVLALPRDSKTLNALLDFTSDEFVIPPFHETKYRGGRGAAIREAIAAGRPIHVGDQPWGVWGPHAVTHFLQVTGEVRYTRPGVVLYPYSFKERRRMLRPIASMADSALTEETMSVHFYGRRMRERLAKGSDGFPEPESLIGRLLIKHRIDPMEAPLRECPNPDPDHPFAKTYRDAARGGAQYPAAAPAPVVQAAERTRGVRPLSRVTAITTMRNEGPYILDWIAYHLGLGITHFLVYTNDCDDPTNAILDRLAELGIVTREDNPFKEGQRPQRVALELAERHPMVTSADAYVVMDVDEYMNIHIGEGRLPDLFAAAGDPDMISMTWRFFGSNGVVEFRDEPVASQFTRAAPLEVRKPHQNWGFKTIVRRGAPFSKIGVHRPLEPTGTMPRWTNGSGAQLPDKYRDSGWRSNRRTWGYNLVTLNHYAIRSIDGFLVKRDRGRTNHVNRDQGIAYWNTHNRNDEEDRSILERLPLMEPARARFAEDPDLQRLHAAACDWHRERALVLNDVGDYAELRTRLLDNPLAYDLEDIPSQAAPPPMTGQEEDESDDSVAILEGQDAEQAYLSLQSRAARLGTLVPLTEQLPCKRVLAITSMRNEAPFILEWIAYHRAIGVTDFLVYTNDCDDPTNQILDALAVEGWLERIDNPYKAESGQKPQRGALNDAVTREAYRNSDWVMVTDVDEFVNIHVGEGRLSDLFSAAGNPNVVSMSWRFFGCKGVDTYAPGFVTEQFVRCAPKFIPKPRLGWGFKSIFHRSAPFEKLGVHRPLNLDQARADEVRWVNGAGRIMPSELVHGNGWRSTKRTIGYDLVTLNHYVLRSAESFLVKRERGRINHVDQDQGTYYWNRRNYTSEKDLSILSRLPRAKEEYLRLLELPGVATLQARAESWHRERIEHLRALPDYASLLSEITRPDQPDALYVTGGVGEGSLSSAEETEDPITLPPQHAAE